MPSTVLPPRSHASNFRRGVLPILLLLLPVFLAHGSTGMVAPDPLVGDPFAPGSGPLQPMPDLSNYPGVLSWQKQQDVLKVTVSGAFARSLTDDHAHDDWISGVFGRYDLAGVDLKGVYAVAEDSTGKPRPLSSFLPPPSLPMRHRGATKRAAAFGGAMGLTHHLPLPYGGSLMGRNIVVGPGHGLRYNEATGYYGWQRPLLKFAGCGTCRGIIEDVFTSEFVHRHLIPLLKQAGARVFSPRELSWETAEIVINNGATGYREEGDGWVDGTSAGGFEGDYRVLPPDRPGTAIYEPQIAAEGLYFVSAWWVAGSNRSPGALYTVHHAGGEERIYVNQRQDSSRWMYLGRFHLVPGKGHGVRITHGEGEGYVMADAVRFGGGVHSAASAPRWHMSAQAHLPYHGAPTSVTNNNDVVIRPIYAEWQGADAYVSVHSNATGGENLNRSGTSTYRYNCGTYADHSTAPSADLCDDPPGSDRLQRALQAAVLEVVRERWDEGWQDRGRRVANFGEMRLLDTTPGVLFEMAYHDNLVRPSTGAMMSDNRALHEPRWRRAAAYGVYKGLVDFFDSEAPLLPDSPRLLSVVGEQGPATGQVSVRVRWEPVARAEAYRLYVAHGDAGFAGSLVVEGEEEALVTASSGVPVFIKVAGLGRGGESLTSEVLGAMVIAHLDGPAQVLAVQGYHREDAWTDEGGNTFDYLQIHGRAIADAGWSFDSVSAPVLEEGGFFVHSYPIVNWALGRQGRESTTLSTNLQTMLLGYSNNGGHVLISGSYLGTDLVSQGVDPSGQFLSELFGAGFTQAMPLAVDEVQSVADSPWGVLPSLSLDRGNIAGYNVESLDSFQALAAGAFVPLVYSTWEGAGVAHQGEAGQGRSVVLGFPFEATHSRGARHDLMDAMLRFLAGGDPPQPPDPADPPEPGSDAGVPVDNDGGVDELDGGFDSGTAPGLDSGMPNMPEEDAGTDFPIRPDNPRQGEVSAEKVSGCGCALTLGFPNAAPLDLGSGMLLLGFLLFFFRCHRKRSELLRR